MTLFYAFLNRGVPSGWRLVLDSHVDINASALIINPHKKTNCRFLRLMIIFSPQPRHEREQKGGTGATRLSGRECFEFQQSTVSVLIIESSENEHPCQKTRRDTGNEETNRGCVS